MVEAQQSNNDKLDFKKVLPIFIIVLVDLLGLTVIIPLLPLYTVAMGASPIMIGLLAATYPLMQLIGAPILGNFSDRYGRKPVLLISQIGTFIGFLILGFASTVTWLFVSRFIDGISGANIVVAQAAISDSTNEKTRTQGLGLLGAAFGLGFTIGPAIAGISLALSNNNYQVPAFLAAGFSLLSIILTQFWFKETLNDKTASSENPSQENHSLFFRLQQAVRNPLIAALLLLMFAQQFVFYGYENLFSLFTLNRLGLNAAGNAVIFVFIGIILIIVQGWAIGPLSRKFGERNLILVGLALLSLGLILSAITPAVAVPWYSHEALLTELSSRSSTEIISVAIPDGAQIGWIGLIWIMVASIPATIGAGLLAPSINSMLTKQGSTVIAGSLLGLSTAVVSAANAVTPLIGGAIFEWYGSTAPFLAGGILLAILWMFANLSVKTNRVSQSQ